MQRSNALVALCSVVSVLVATPVLATPRHHQQETHLTKHHKKAAHRAVHSAVIQRARHVHTAQGPSQIGGFAEDSSLVADARRYLGTNPTGRRSLWCGAFMDKVLRDTGHRGGGNLATGYLHYGHRVSGPRVGAIAVMYRRGGGHVGVVSGVDANGNPIVISGNTWGDGSGKHRVMEQVYPRSRIAAYVLPEK